MTDAKPLASLSSSLLARKGHARPAMRPQAMIADREAGQSLEDLGWNDMGEDAEAHHKAHLATINALTPMTVSPAKEQLQELSRAFEDSGEEPADWPDFEDEGRAPEAAGAVHPVEPEPEFGQAVAPQPVAVQPVAIAPVPGPTPVMRAAPGSKGKSAFTLRLDPDRHLKLRLQAAFSHRSAQQIVTQALDEFLERNAPANSINPSASAA